MQLFAGVKCILWKMALLSIRGTLGVSLAFWASLSPGVRALCNRKPASRPLWMPDILPALPYAPLHLMRGLDDYCEA